MTLEQRIHTFIAEEAHLLDARKWDAWQELFAPDGMYWMPAKPDQTSPKDHVSLVYESAMLRDIRINRLKKLDGLSVERQPRSVHHISNIVVDLENTARNARAMVMYVQYVGGETSTFHGHVSWQFSNTDEKQLKLDLKRVDLVNADGVLSDILSFI